MSFWCSTPSFAEEMDDCDYSYVEELEYEEDECSMEFVDELESHFFDEFVEKNLKLSSTSEMTILDCVLLRFEAPKTTSINDTNELTSNLSANTISLNTIEEIDEELKNLEELYQNNFVNIYYYEEIKRNLHLDRENSKHQKQFPHKDFSKIAMMGKKLSSTGKNNNIRLFISSTFKDMNIEREVLMKDVFPKLQKICSNRGIFITQVDLRWGITSEQSEQGDTINICLREIDRSRPYFVCMLGQRYGWTQNKDKSDTLLHKTFQQGSINFPWISKYKDKSITELEIRHAVLNDTTSLTARNALFYVKELGEGSTVDDERLTQLKNELEGSGMNINYYENPNHLSLMFFEHVSKLIERDFPLEDKPSPIEVERMAHLSFQESRSRIYVGREEYFSYISSQLYSGVPVVIVGESGSGKSALVANWANNYARSFPDKLIIAHYIGSTASSSEITSLLRRVLWEINTHFSLAKTIPSDPKEMEKVLPEFLVEASSQGGIVLVFDALNQLSDPVAQELRWLPREYPSNIGVVVSTLSSRCLDVIQSRGWPQIKIQPLSIQERHKFTQEYMAQYSKSLSSRQMEKIVLSAQCNNPLYMRTLLEELRLFGVFEHLDIKIEYYLKSINPPKLFELVFERLEIDFEVKNPGIISNLLCAIWASRRGLTEVEILQILEITPAVWAPLNLALEDSLVNQSGYYTFFHDYMRQAVESKYKEKCLNSRMKLIKLFHGNAIKQREIEEVPYQYLKLSNLLDLSSFISIPENFFLLAQEENRMDLYSYWRSLGNVSSVENTLFLGLKSYNDTKVLEAISNFLRDVASFNVAEKIYQMLITQVESNNSPFDLVSALRNLAVLYEKKGKYSSAAPLLERALTYSQHISQDLVATVLVDLSIIYRRQGKFKESMPLIQKALNAQKKLFGDLNSNVARTKNEFGRLQQDLGDYGTAYTLFRESFQDMQSLLGQKHPTVALYLKDIADLYVMQSRFEEAMQIFEDVLKMYEFSIGKSHPDYADTLQSMGTALQQQGKWVEAEKCYVISIELCKSIYGNKHPDIARTLLEYSQLNIRQRNFKEAEELCNEGYKMLVEVHGEKHRDVANALTILGAIYNKKEDYNTSLTYYKKGLELQEEIYGKNHMDIGVTLLNIAGIYQKQRKASESLPLYVRALETFLDLLGTQHAYNCVALNDIAILYNSIGDWAQSKKMYDIALNCYISVFGRRHQSTAQMLLNYGNGLISHGDLKEGLALVEEAASIFMETIGPEHDKTKKANNVLLTHKL